VKLSIEAKVAAAVATAFVALTVGAIGQEHGGGQTGRVNGYGLRNNPPVNTYLSEQGYDSSLIGGLTPSSAKRTRAFIHGTLR
jgi:hypothetical protein